LRVQESDRITDDLLKPSPKGARRKEGGEEVSIFLSQMRTVFEPVWGVRYIKKHSISNK